MFRMAVDRKSTAKVRHWAFVLGMLLVGAGADGAQLVRGSISGTILDAQEQPLQDVQITATDEDTRTQTVIKSQSGVYTVPLLPGSYTIEFRFPGFATDTVTGVRVVASRSTTINRVLRIESLTTRVDVVDLAGDQLDKAAPSIQQGVPGRLLDEIPMTSSSLVPGGSRNQTRIAWFAPNVTHVTGQNETSVHGHRPRENNYMLDGTNNNDESVTLPVLFTPPEAVREVQIQVVPFSAEFGRNLGGQINLVTRNGTNSYHGELWEFYRASALEPLSLQNKKAGRIPCSQASPGVICGSPRLLDHQFGGSFGGPIVQDKTFFFGLLQFNRQRQPSRTLSAVTIPTPGGYAALQNVPLRAGQSAASRQSVLEALSFLPEVHSQIRNFTGISTTALSVNAVPIEVGTFIPTAPQDQNLWYLAFRADHHFTIRDQLSYRVHIDDRLTPLSSGNLAFGEKWGADSQYNAQNHTLTYTKIVGDRVVNEARLAFVRLDPSFVERDPITSTVNIGGPASFTIGGAAGFPQQRSEETVQFQNVSTYLVSRHTLKFGADLTRIRSVNNNAGNFKGTWNFQNLENFMNSQPTSLTQLVHSMTRYNFTQMKQAYFFQDDFKLRRSFTLNLGLRYETASVPLDYFGTDDPQLQALVVPPPAKRDTNNWAPRIGFAYSPEFDSGLLGKVFGVGQSSIRGGIGMGYDVLFHSLLSIPASNYPRNSTQQAYSSQELLDLYPTLLIPRVTTPSLNSQTNFVNITPDAQHPTSTYWSLSIQRQLNRNYVLEVGYSGNRSYHLLRQSQANPGAITDAKAAAVIANCTAATMPACQDSSDSSDPRYPQSPSRINPQAGSRILFETDGNSEYHAGFIRLERKIARTLQFGINYTWSANFSDSDETLPLDPLLTGSSPQVPQNYFDRRAEWARSAFDRPHRVAAHYSYQIPWFENSPAAVKHIMAGWQLSGFTEVQSGQPFTIRIGVDALGAGTATGARPNYNPGGIILPDPVTGDYRTFTIPLDGTGIVTAPHVVSGTGSRTFLKNSMPQGGTLGRNTLRGPGFSNTNMSLMKRFTLPGEAQLQIRGDFINVFNHDNFPNPDNVMSSATFGQQIHAPLTDARQVLLGAKLQF